MKYKAIKSMAHNFSHSFLSCMNYVDGGYVVDDLKRLALQAEGNVIQIHWIPHTNLPEILNERIRKSVGHYRDRLPKHIKNHKLDREAIREFRTDILLLPNRQVVARAYALDDRGKEHVCSVAY